MSVNVNPDPPNADIDEFEKSISRQFAFFLRNARNIRMIADVSQRLKREKNWGLSQEFVSYNTTFHKWPEELPADLKVNLPADGAVPKLSSHFIGNMHSHYQLAIVMLRRPQLTASQEFGKDSEWRKHMAACYRSAKILCRLQEAVLAQYDLSGLLCMQRGINFTIYAILTCVMIHLVSCSWFLLSSADLFRSRLHIPTLSLMRTPKTISCGICGFLKTALPHGRCQRQKRRSMDCVRPFLRTQANRSS